MPPVTRSQTTRERQLRESSSRRNERATPLATELQSAGRIARRRAVSSRRLASGSSIRLERQTSRLSPASIPTPSPDPVEDMAGRGAGRARMQELYKTLDVFEPSPLSDVELQEPELADRRRATFDGIVKTRSKYYSSIKEILLEYCERDPELATRLCSVVPKPIRKLDQLSRAVDRCFAYHNNYIQPDKPMGNHREMMYQFEDFEHGLRRIYEHIEAIRVQYSDVRMCAKLVISIELAVLQHFSTFPAVRGHSNLNFERYVPLIHKFVTTVGQSETALFGRMSDIIRDIVMTFQSNYFTYAQHILPHLGLESLTRRLPR